MSANIRTSPKEYPYRDFITNEWSKIQKRIIDGLPVDNDVLRLDNELKSIKTSIVNVENTLNLDKTISEIDRISIVSHQKYDLKIATDLHEFYKSWVSFGLQQRAGIVDYWKMQTKRFYEFSEKISLAAFSTLTLLHGGVAVGALNIIASKTPVSSGALIAAKVAIPCALIGIFTLGLGFLMIFHFGTRVYTVIERRTMQQVRYITLRAAFRFLYQQGRGIRTGNMFIYGSIFWFFAYCFALYIILMSYQ